MSDTIAIFRESFKKYMQQEKDVISLKRYFDFAPDLILMGMTDARDPSDFWNVAFKKMITEFKIEKHTREQPDWVSVRNQLLGKRNREPSGSSGVTPSSSPASSSSAVPSTSTETTTKRRKKLTTFLSGKVPPKITLDPEIEKWVVAEEQVSELFVQYRTISIEKAQQGQLDTYQEEMSINGIFLIDGINCVYPYSQVEYGFDKRTWDAMVDECNNLYPVDSLRETTANSIMKLSKAIKKDIQQCRQIVNGINEEEDSINESLNSMLNLYSPKASKKIDQHESTFSLSAVHPMILPFLQESHLTTTNGTDGKTLKKESENASKKGCHFSDLSVNFEYGAMPKQALAIVEIKAPHKVRNGSRPDLVKLSYQMKDSIDKMIDDKMDDKDITVLGILVEGFRCTLFIMDLRYQGLYRLIPLSVFFIPRERHDFCLVASSYEALSTMQRMVASNAEKCFQFHRNKKRQTVRDKFVVKSYNAA